MTFEPDLTEATSDRPDRFAGPGVVTAVVRVSGLDIRYRRAGAGAPVLLLRSTAVPGADHLFAALAARFLVISPERVPVGGPPLSTDFGDWLDGIIEGLGLERPCVISDRASSLELLRYATRHPERAAGIAMVLLDGPDLAGLQAEELGEIVHLVTSER